jgi:hypothetical protein
MGRRDVHRSPVFIGSGAGQGIAGRGDALVAAMNPLRHDLRLALEAMRASGTFHVLRVLLKVEMWVISGTRHK